MKPIACAYVQKRSVFFPIVSALVRKRNKNISEIKNVTIKKREIEQTLLHPRDPLARIHPLHTAIDLPPTNETTTRRSLRTTTPRSLRTTNTANITALYG